ncbi:MAG: hypothetical protein ACI97A_003029 [Planctomycetota bacterium]|jgi:hypothetical protein
MDDQNSKSKVVPMKLIQFRSLALVLCLALVPGCAIGNTRYVTSKSHEAALSQEGEMELAGIDGQITIRNAGPGMVQVTRSGPNGDVLESVDLQPKTDCMLTLRAIDRLKIYNPSDAKTTIETLTVD